MATVPTSPTSMEQEEVLVVQDPVRREKGREAPTQERVPLEVFSNEPIAVRARTRTPVIADIDEQPRHAADQSGHGDERDHHRTSTDNDHHAAVPLC